MSIFKTTDYINFKMENKPDWICHLVMYGKCAISGEIETSPVNQYLCDCHTHGVTKYGDYELQVVVKLPREIIGYLLNTVGAMIRAGAKLQDGDYIENLINDYSVLILKNADIDGKGILRIVLPDAQGRFPKDTGCDLPYSLQGLSTYIITNGFEKCN